MSARQIPTPKVLKSKFPPLNQWSGCNDVVSAGVVMLVLPLGGCAELVSACSGLSAHTRNGLCLVAALLWSSCKRQKGGQVVMRLVKPAACRFVDLTNGTANPATFVARAWRCEPARRGNNINGHVANTWFAPEWCDGSSEKVPVRLTPHQLARWNRRSEILRECLDAANPHAALVRQTLAVTMPGPAFEEMARQLTLPGERKAARSYIKRPNNINLTIDGDVQSNVARLPDVLRATLRIDGQPVAEFDVKSAHAVLLGMFYANETGAEWLAERERFAEEVLRGFVSIYGEGKEWKIEFLSALNQRTCVARNASEGYREFERLFPLLAGKLWSMKRHDRNAVGRRLRCELAKIMGRLVIENAADGIRSIPVVDSAVVAMPGDAFARHQAEFSAAWRLGMPIAELTGTAPLITGSNGENYRFFV